MLDVDEFCGAKSLQVILSSFIKLSPLKIWRNPVMFIAEVGAIITTVAIFVSSTNFSFDINISVWLWFTVLFANFAEAIAEGKGKAQADCLNNQKAYIKAQCIRSPIFYRLNALNHLQFLVNI